MLVYVEIETDSEYIREPGNDGWDRGDSTCTLLSVKAYEKSYGDFVDESLIQNNTVYAVIEDVSTGDTFGHCDSCFYVRGVFATYELAQEATKSLPTYDDYFGGHNQWLVEPASLN